MLQKLLIVVLSVTGILLAQTDTDIDTLLRNHYQKTSVRYECFPVFLFPFFALNEPRPPLKSPYKGYTEKGYSYYRFYDKEGVHFLFSSISYKKKSRTYTLFFYTTKQGRWIQEMSSMTITFDLVGDTYVPR